MNADRRKDLEKARGMLEEAKAIVEQAATDERDYYDNMSENLQGGDKGQQADACADKLQEIADAMDTHVSELQDCIDGNA